MKYKFEVPYEDLLCDNYNRSVIKFNTTEDIEGDSSIIGQERAESAMEFGISIKEQRYNIYVAGTSGIGKRNYIKKVLESKAKSDPVPDDWCFVYNFDNEYEPIALNFRAGRGRVFKNDMENVLEEVIDKIPYYFESYEYDKQKNEILGEYHDIKNKLLDELAQDAKSLDIQLKNSETGYLFIPIIDDKPMSEEEYNNLEKEEKDIILDKIAKIRIKAMSIIRELKFAEKAADKKIEMLDRETGLYGLNDIFSNLLLKYSTESKVIEYIQSVKEDILKYIEKFLDDLDEISDTKKENSILSRYKVNLLVDNGDLKGSPIIFDYNPTYTNLIGSVEYESKLGTLSTDFLKIKAGSIIKANGGYLILYIEDVIKNYKSWESIKSVIKSGVLSIESMRNQLDLLTITSLKPSPIPVNLKIILIGSEYIYRVLYEHDNEFKYLFKVKVDFDSEIEKNDANVYKLAECISNHCRENKIRHVDRSGVSTIIEYSSKIAGSRKKLSSNLDGITDIINESNIWADIQKSKYISSEHIKKAIRENKKRNSLIEDKFLEVYENKRLMIDTQGEAVGQINGLSVIEVGGHRFGRPCRITASTYMGKQGIVNIEREARLSGSIHDKGVFIIGGFLGARYASKIPLSMSGHICFEQSYGSIDGDSASAAELLALLSSISGTKMKQSIAVTGSINQKGDIQPVGGINEKIEGFYKVCSMFGLSKKQGVIIPYSNLDDIILDDDILKDIKKGIFHLYAIKNIDEGIEILTNLKPGIRGEDGEFEYNTFNYLVDKGLYKKL